MNSISDLKDRIILIYFSTHWRNTWKNLSLKEKKKKIIWKNWFFTPKGTQGFSQKMSAHLVQPLASYSWHLYIYGQRALLYWRLRKFSVCLHTVHTVHTVYDVLNEFWWLTINILNKARTSSVLRSSNRKHTKKFHIPLNIYLVSGSSYLEKLRSSWQSKGNPVLTRKYKFSSLNPWIQGCVLNTTIIYI